MSEDEFEDVLWDDYETVPLAHNRSEGHNLTLIPGNESKSHPLYLSLPINLNVEIHESDTNADQGETGGRKRKRNKSLNKLSPRLHVRRGSNAERTFALNIHKLHLVGLISHAIHVMRKIQSLTWRKSMLISVIPLEKWKKWKTRLSPGQYGDLVGTVQLVLNWMESHYLYQPCFWTFEKQYKELVSQGEVHETKTQYYQNGSNFQMAEHFVQLDFSKLGLDPRTCAKESISALLGCQLFVTISEMLNIPCRMVWAMDRVVYPGKFANLMRATQQPHSTHHYPLKLEKLNFNYPSFYLIPFSCDELHKVIIETMNQVKKLKAEEMRKRTKLCAPSNSTHDPISSHYRHTIQSDLKMRIQYDSNLDIKSDYILKGKEKYPAEQAHEVYSSIDETKGNVIKSLPSSFLPLVWVEVFCLELKKWIMVDVVRGLIDARPYWNTLLNESQICALRLAPHGPLEPKSIKMPTSTNQDITPCISPTRCSNSRKSKSKRNKKSKRKSKRKNSMNDENGDDETFEPDLEVSYSPSITHRSTSLPHQSNSLGGYILAIDKYLRVHQLGAIYSNAYWNHLALIEDATWLDQILWWFELDPKPISSFDAKLDNSDQSSISSPSVIWDAADHEALSAVLDLDPFPKTCSAYRTNQRYCLTRFLTKVEMLRPDHSLPVHYFRGEPVYLRKDVGELHTIDKWLQLGMQIKVNQEPVTELRKRIAENVGLDDDEAEMSPYYGDWQVEPYIPPRAIEGQIPKNKYGNVYLFKPEMLPLGTHHITGLHPNIKSICRRLGVDVAPAMIGWIQEGSRSTPCFHGWVVCEEVADIVVQHCKKDAARKAYEQWYKEHEMIRSWWRDLVKHALIKNKLDKNYQSNQESGTSPNTIRGYSRDSGDQRDPKEKERPKSGDVKTRKNQSRRRMNKENKSDRCHNGIKERDLEYDEKTGMDWVEMSQVINPQDTDPNFTSAVMRQFGQMTSPPVEDWQGIHVHHFLEEWKEFDGEKSKTIRKCPCGFLDISTHL